MKKELKDNVRFSITARHQYKDGLFEAGLVKDSPHKVNKIYLRVGEMFFHLRDDEAFAIMGALSEALWTHKILSANKKLGGIKWYRLSEIIKNTPRKPKAMSPKLTPSGKYLTMKEL